MRTKTTPRSLAGFLAAVFSANGLAGSATNAPSGDLLLTGPLGQSVEVSTNSIPRGFLPPASMGIQSQVPVTFRGLRVPDAVQERQEQSRQGHETLEFFPAYQPKLSPYLAAQDELGNTALHPGPLIPPTLLDIAVQQAKYLASEIGLWYSLQQTFTGVGMTDVMQGNKGLGFYTFKLQSKWTVFDAPAAGSAGWVSAQINAQTGLGAAGDTQDARTNLGSITNPTSIWSSHQGFRIPELAWQQSFRDGEIVAIVGMVSQGNYLDVNSYANTGRGQFLNSALINSMVIPIQDYNLGVNLQWQVMDEFYAMLGSSVGNGYPGVVPWTDFSWDNWSLVGEFGWAPKDVFGLGPGVYRIQPFVGQAEGYPAQVGFGLNCQQQLGQDSRFGWFGRFGHGGREKLSAGSVSGATGSQIGTGFIMRGPLEYLGLFPSRGQDAAGLGFVWSHPTADTKPLYHDNEYVLEAGYVLQLTPTAKLQPDIQVVWNPASNPDPGPAAVFQLQLDVAW